jgi:hypothetical protein
MKRKVWRLEDLVGIPHDAKAHDFAVERIGAIITGRPPPMQGAILADLVGMYFAGYAPEMREDAITQWTEVMHKLIDLHAKKLLAEYGGKWPEDDG